MVLDALHTQLRAFRKWAEAATAEHDGWQTDYPLFNELVGLVDTAFSQDPLPDEATNAVLEVLALDNENEQVLRVVASYPNNAVLLALKAHAFPDSRARWQMAVALGIVGTEGALAELRWFLLDADEYVRRRAFLALRDHDPKGAEAVALLWLRSPHEYHRMVALDTLATIGSTHLSRAITLLSDDPSWAVQKRLSAIRSGGVA